MLNKLIPHIDIDIAELKYFSTLYGLAEKIKEGKEKNARQFPAVFIGNDNYEQVELEKMSCYHRMIGERSFSELTENLWGCSKAFEMTYPMVFVGCLKHSSGCEVYESDQIANSVANKLYQVQFPASIRALIKVYSIELFLKAIETDRSRIWEEEYEHIENAMTFDMIYFSVKYEFKIKGDSSCLNIIEC